MNKIHSGSPSIVVSNTSLPYISSGSSSYANGAPAGQIWWDTSNQCFKISDGSNWQLMNQVTTINLAYDAEQAIAWAKQKQREEQELEELMRKHPGLQDAHDAFKVMLVLVKDHNKDENAAP